ncbi:hypothetical protein IAU60_000337 [Kwoniella sp. DSM 27419]
MSLHTPLEGLGLPKDFLDAANRANLTASAILLMPIPRLAELLRVRVPVAQSVVSQVSRAVCPTARTVHEVYTEGNSVAGPSGSRDATGVEDTSGKGKQRGRWISTGDEGMDEALGGGLRRGCLYEITGESAAGKSHLALTLALSTQLPSLCDSPGSSLVLTSERELPTDRLVQLGKSLLATHEPHTVTTGGEGRIRSLLDNVITNRLGDADALEHALNYALPAILEARLNGSGGRQERRTRSDAAETYQGPPERSASTITAGAPAAATTSTSQPRQRRRPNPLPVRLIILDSITALFRGGTSSHEERPTALSAMSLTERSKRLCIVADVLKSLAVTYDLAVVVINQVSDVFQRPRSAPLATPPSPPTSSFTQTQAFTGAKRSLGVDGYDASVEAAAEADPPMLYASQARWFSGQSAALRKEASLGIVWANAINVRIMLSRTGRRRLLHQADLKRGRRRKAEEEAQVGAMPGPTQVALEHLGLEVDDVKPTLVRRMHVVFSPFSPACTIDYAITSTGLHSLPGSMKVIDVTEVVRKRREREELARQRELEEVQRLDGSVTVATGQEDVGDEEDQDFDVFDDFGDLPAEFWQDGNVQLNHDGQVILGDVEGVGRVIPVNSASISQGTDELSKA